MCAGGVTCKPCCTCSRGLRKYYPTNRLVDRSGSAHAVERHFMVPVCTPERTPHNRSPIAYLTLVAFADSLTRRRTCSTSTVQRIYKWASRICRPSMPKPAHKHASSHQLWKLSRRHTQRGFLVDQEGPLTPIRAFRRAR